MMRGQSDFPNTVGQLGPRRRNLFTADMRKARPDTALLPIGKSAHRVRAWPARRGVDYNTGLTNSIKKR